MILVLFFVFIPLSYSIPICSSDLGEVLSTSKRIPKNLIPINYLISYKFDEELTLFNGSVDIKFLVKIRTNRIILHSSVNILSISVVGGSDTDSSIVNIQMQCIDTVNNLLVLELDRELNVDESGTISISFNDQVSKSSTGIFESKYFIESGESRKIVVTHFEPKYARTAYPCFDEPSLKAVFKLKLKYPARYNSLSNTSPDMITINNDYKSVHYMPTPIMSTYMLAFAIHNYESITTYSNSSKKISIWLPAHIVQQGRIALDVASKAIDLLEKRFNIAYILSKIDIIGVSGFLSFGEENWGLITCKLSSLVVNDDQFNAIDQQKEVSSLIIHEIGHQWFGNMITMEWWSELWLKEGLARFMEYFVGKILFPQWSYDVKIFHLINSAMLVDQSTETHALSISEAEVGEIILLFNQILYDKSFSILLILYSRIEETEFVEILKSLLFQYQYKNFKCDDFLKIIKDVTNNSLLVDIMFKWVRNKGFPLITVQHKSDSYYTVSQERHLVTANEKLLRENSESNVTWIIPIRYNILPLSCGDEVILVTDKNGTYNLCGSGTIKISYDLHRFYRVNYDPNTWLELRNYLISQSNKFTEVDRYSLVSDIFTLNHINRVDIRTLLVFISYMSMENDRYVLIEIINKLLQIHQLLYGYPTTMKRFEAYILRFIAPIFRRTSTDTSVDSDLEKLFRNNLFTINILFKNPDAIQQSTELFQHLLQNVLSINRENFYIIASAVCATLYQASKTEWLDVLDLYKSATFGLKSALYIYALTCVENKEILRMYLELSLNESVLEVKHPNTMMLGIAENPYGLDIGWEHLKSHWEYFVFLYKNSIESFHQIIIGYANRMKTRAQLEDFRNFIISKGFILDDFNNIIENIAIRINWFENQFGPLNDWLDHNQLLI